MWRGQGDGLLTLCWCHSLNTYPVLLHVTSLTQLTSLCRLAVDVCTKPAHATNSSSSHPSKGGGSTPHGGTRSFSTGTGMGTVTERQSGGNSRSSSNTVRSVSTAAPSTSTNVSSGSGSGKPPQGSTRAYSGTFDCLRATYQLEGLRGVYAGFGVSLLGAISYVAPRFSARCARVALQPVRVRDWHLAYPMLTLYASPSTLQV
jgi:hypothetical protein